MARGRALPTNGSLLRALGGDRSKDQGRGRAELARAPARNCGQSALSGRTDRRTARSSLEFGARENSIQGRIERRRRQRGGEGGGEKRLPDGRRTKGRAGGGGGRQARDKDRRSRSSKGEREREWRSEAVREEGGTEEERRSRQQTSNQVLAQLLRSETPQHSALRCTAMKQCSNALPYPDADARSE